MEQEYCQNCKNVKSMEESQWALEFSAECDALRKEEARMLDDGMATADVFMHFKNRLWKMFEETADIRSAKIVALQSFVASADALVAMEYYQKAGWRRKHSGEWVKG